jgi:hypothetical protein
MTTTFEARLKEQQNQIQQLQGKVRKLEGKITKLDEQEVTVIKDSIEDLAHPSFKSPRLVRNSNVSRKVNARPKAFSHARDLLPEVEEENDTNLRSVQPEETESADFDLDAGVATMSYARQLRCRGTQEDSMQMLPKLPLPQQAPRVEEESILQQGCSQSWHQYIKEGRDLIERMEAAIARAFVAGILNPPLRARCQHWLDDRAWNWKNIESFDTHLNPPETSPEPASTAEPTPEQPQRTRGPAVPRKGADSQRGKRELARLLEDQGGHRLGSFDISQSPEADGYRRSQRIRNKNHTVSQQANGSRQPEPVNRTNKRSVHARAERRIRTRNLRKQAANAPDTAVANAVERKSVQLQSIKNNATESKQAVRAQETRTLLDIRNTKEAVSPAAHMLPGRGEDRDLPLQDITDRKLREQVRKLHEVFPGETINICREALMAKHGNYEEACILIVERTAQYRKTQSTQNARQRSKQLRSKKREAVRPSTSKRINGHGEAMSPAPPNSGTGCSQPPLTPEAQMHIGRVSYKRKADPSEGVANTKRARLAKRKRAPAPDIPILPSSDTE